MALSSLDSLVGYLRRVAPAGADGDDGQLLARFAAGEELAFAALVHRYAGLVWGVCRRTLPRQPDAEDAFQATFLVLLRKAAALARNRPLGPWLHRVASRTAVKARVRAARQTSREYAVAVPEADMSSDDAELRTLLDEEVGRLPEKYRQPVVLCYLEGLTNEQAADRLGCPRGTIQSRLSRAREQLRQRLRRRGVELPAHLAGSLPTVPAALIEAVVHGSVFRAGVVSTSVLTLAEGVLFGMTMHKVRLAALAILTLAALAGVGVWAGRPDASGSPPATKTATREKKTEAAPPAAKAESSKKNKPAPASTPLKIRDALREDINFQGFEDPKTTLVEALDHLQKIYKVNFDINEKAFQVEQLPDVLKTLVADPHPILPMKASLATVLKKILVRVPVSSGATFLIRKDHIEITTGDAVRRELGLRKLDVPPTDDPAEARPGLSPLVYDELKKVPLNKALRDLAEETGVNVIIDARIEKKTSEEVTATFRNVPVETAVEVLADMAGLSVVMRNNVIYVTSAENAQRLLKSKRWFSEPQRMPTPNQPPGGAM